MHGIQVYNDSGILQIDSTYRNMELVSSGSAVATTSFFTMKFVDINVVGINPIIALRHLNGVTCLCVGKVSSTFTFRLFTYNVDEPGADAPDMNINYWVFDSSSGPSSTHGLQVYNDSGNLCYDSTKKYFRVLNANHATGTIAYSGKSILVAPCSFGYLINFILSPTNPNLYHRQVSFRIAKVHGDTLEVRSTIIIPDGPFQFAGDSYQHTGRFAVLDVTGYGI